MDCEDWFDDDAARMDRRRRNMRLTSRSWSDNPEHLVLICRTPVWDDFPFQMYRNDSLGDLKYGLAPHSNLNARDFGIEFRGMLLSERCIDVLSLEDYGLRNGSRVVVVPRRTGGRRDDVDELRRAVSRLTRPLPADVTTPETSQLAYKPALHAVLHRPLSTRPCSTIPRPVDEDEANDLDRVEQHKALIASRIERPAPVEHREMFVPAVRRDSAGKVSDWLFTQPARRSSTAGLTSNDADGETEATDDAHMPDVADCHDEALQPAADEPLVHQPPSIIVTSPPPYSLTAMDNVPSFGYAVSDTDSSQSESEAASEASEDGEKVVRVRKPLFLSPTQSPPTSDDGPQQGTTISSKPSSSESLRLQAELASSPRFANLRYKFSRPG